MKYIPWVTPVRDRSRPVADPAHLRALRESARLSGAELALRLGCCPQYIYQVETGATPCSRRILAGYIRLERELPDPELLRAEA